MIRFLTTLVLLLTATAALQAADKPKYAKAPGADLKQEILWGATSANPDRWELSFGGIDQKSNDGRPHTRIKRDGQWVSVADELARQNPQQAAWEKATKEAQVLKLAVAHLRFAYFEGEPAIRKHLGEAEKVIGQGAKTDDGPRLIERTYQLQLRAEKAAERLAAEPGGRCLSPIVWEPRHKVFVIFGGDHMDFLRNDLWVFDPAKLRWEQRPQDFAPPPRANHSIQANGDGTVTVSGGYTYFNEPWYCGPLYQEQQDGEWVYNLANNTWKGPDGAKGVPSDSPTYRDKMPPPLTYVTGPQPAGAATTKQLAVLRVKGGVAMNPPLKPIMNRDWGSACIDTDRDVMLQWSGGHSAHGGSDVVLYHFATNRWEVPFPMEFPLGQTYSNTSYPTGFNLNRRPWPSGHTYKCFGYDPHSKTMLFLGHSPWCYVFDAGVGDWTGRSTKPSEMNYNDSFYTLTCVTTDAGLVVWSRGGEVFRYDAQTRQWQPIRTSGKLPDPSVDHCGLAWDSQRNRLIFFPTTYNKPFTGKVVTLGLSSGEVKQDGPPGIERAATLPAFLRENVYLSESDTVLILGATLPPTRDGRPRPTLGYDCAADRWVVYQLGGANPAGKDGRNVSLGVVYDPKRKLIWACDANNQVWVLRPDLSTAERE
jgi:hypothetical protein